MTDKERLEDVKQDVKMIRKDLAVSPSNEMTLNMGILLNTMDWLIERAEKNMTCQEVLDLQKDALKGILEQNKRYREALELLNRVSASDMKDEQLTSSHFVLDITGDALEESK